MKPDASYFRLFGFIATNQKLVNPTNCHVISCSFLLLENRLKPTVYCELSYALSEGRKMYYLIVYQTQKCRRLVYTFVVDQS